MPPPGAGVTTVIATEPAVAMSPAVMLARSSVPLTNVVERMPPSQRTTDDGTKPLPFTMSVNAGPPATAVLGLRVPTTGTGFGAMTANVSAVEVPPPGAGVTTLTVRAPGVAMSPAVMVVSSCVALTNVVGRLEPFHCTTDELTNRLPVTVSVNDGPPARALLGDSSAATGAGFGATIVNVRAADVPPPGAGVTTVTGTVPAVAMSAAAIVARTSVALTNMVGRLTPFHCTTDELMKLVPVTASVNSAPPATTLLGLSAVDTGVGFGATTVNVSGADVPPPGAGVATVTGTAPAFAMSAATMETRSSVLLTKVVGRPTPFHRTTDELTKLLPVTASVKSAPPATALLGLRAVATGVGFGATIVNVSAADVPPPGAGVATVTGTEPAVAMSAAVIVARSSVALTKVVERGAPFHRTTDDATKLLPVTVSVKAGPPAMALLGSSAVATGTGFGAVIVNVIAVDVPPPGAGVTTVTGTAPAVGMSAAAMVVRSSVALTKFVERGDPFQ